MNVQEVQFRNFALESSRVAFSPDRASFRERAAAVAEAAATEAEAVDREARFPLKAIDAARKERLLGAQIPIEFGGDGASISEVADMCYALGRACASAGMIFAMHQTKIACLIRHGAGSGWHERLMRRVAAEQLLLASSTTEGQNGGNIRVSSAAVEREGPEISLERDATVISYGAEADGIVTIARRADDAAGSDQVMLAITRDDYTLEQTLAWETLGMRGTCSAGFKLNFKGSAEQIFPVAYERIHAQTMTPVAHLCWSSVWRNCGAAVGPRAAIHPQGRLRMAATCPAAPHLPPDDADETGAIIAANLGPYAPANRTSARCRPSTFSPRSTFQGGGSSRVVAVLHAMRACGLSGYRNDTDVSIGHSATCFSSNHDQQRPHPRQHG